MRKARLKALVTEALMDRGYSETEAIHIINLIAMPKIKEPDYNPNHNDEHINIGDTP